MKKKAKKMARKVSRSLKGSMKKAEGPVRPLGDRVLLKPVPVEEGKKLPSGIIIPETIDKEKPETGIVIAVGPGKRGEDGSLVPVNVKVGDRVVFSKYGYDEVKVDGIEYYVVREENILAVISK